MVDIHLVRRLLRRKECRMNEILRRRAMSNNESVDWESIARGLVDYTTPFTPYIPDEVTKIRSSLFQGCEIDIVVLPDLVTDVENTAFANSTIQKFVAGSGLRRLSSPNGVVYAWSIFRNCKKLTDVVLNEGLLWIGYETFRGCSALRQLTIPSTVTAIGDYAVYGIAGDPVVITMLGNVPPTVKNSSFYSASVIYVPDAAYDDYLTAWASYDFVSKVKKESEKPI